VREAYRRQLAAADSSSAYTVVQNQLGVEAHLELDYGDHTYDTVSTSYTLLTISCAHGHGNRSI
jgi:hypothetical protein